MYVCKYVMRSDVSFFENIPISFLLLKLFVDVVNFLPWSSALVEEGITLCYRAIALLPSSYGSSVGDTSSLPYPASPPGSVALVCCYISVLAPTESPLVAILRLTLRAGPMSPQPC